MSSRMASERPGHELIFWSLPRRRRTMYTSNTPTRRLILLSISRKRLAASHLRLKPYFPTMPSAAAEAQPRYSTTPPREASRAAGPRRKKLLLNSVWRDWFGKDEVCLGAALSSWFRPAEETLSGLHAKLVTERDNQRHWLICSRERIYMAVDRPNLVEPEITWSYPVDCDDKRRPRIKIALAGSNDTDFIVSVAGQQVYMTRSLFPKGEPTSGLYRRISKIAREDGPTRGDIQTNDIRMRYLERHTEFSGLFRSTR